MRKSEWVIHTTHDGPYNFFVPKSYKHKIRLIISFILNCNEISNYESLLLFILKGLIIGNLLRIIININLSTLKYSNIQNKIHKLSTQKYYVLKIVL